MSVSKFDFTERLDDRLAAMEQAKNGDDVVFLAAAVRHFRQAVADEREACAHVAEDPRRYVRPRGMEPDAESVALKIAAAIRARGATESPTA